MTTHKLVPIEPTEAMLRAANRARYGWTKGGSAGSYVALVYYDQNLARHQKMDGQLQEDWQAHRAMLAAAPAPPVAIAHEAVELPLNPTPAMLDAGAQRLVSFEDGSVWSDSWEPHQIAGARNEAERVWRSMVLAWAEGQDPGVQPGVKCASCGLHRPLDRFALLATPTASDRPVVRAEDAKDAERYRTIRDKLGIVEWRELGLIDHVDFPAKFDAYVDDRAAPPAGDDCG